MSSRSFRLETRSRARDEIKKIMQTVEKVRKWEKKWIDMGVSNSLKVYKWVPVRDDNPEEDEDKENDAFGLAEDQQRTTQPPQGEPTLPDILPSAPVTVVPDLKLGSTQINLAPVQALPEMLLDTDDGNKLTEPNTAATDLLSSLLPSNDESPMDITTTPPQEPQITTPEVATKPETVENVEDAGIEVAQQEATSAVATSDDTVQPTQRSEEGVEAAKDNCPSLDVQDMPAVPSEQSTTLEQVSTHLQTESVERSLEQSDAPSPKKQKLDSPDS
ncbi:B-cell CLL/lymphoma 7 protein family member B-like [Halichondria panicea]|uniref:B-cell CLL/lymphoma 7 protein family member B-like n=1 Tax=Halichondria panicea TaxID=6063 RepID=UPI00312BBF70